MLLRVTGLPAAEVTRRLAAEDVIAPAGSFYAVEAARHAGLGDEGGVRVGLSAYTSQHDVGRLLAALRSVRLAP